MLFTYCFVWPIIKTLVNGFLAKNQQGCSELLGDDLSDPSYRCATLSSAEVCLF